MAITHVWNDEENLYFNTKKDACVYTETSSTSMTNAITNKTKTVGKEDTWYAEYVDEIPENVKKMEKNEIIYYIFEKNTEQLIIEEKNFDRNDYLSLIQKMYKSFSKNGKKKILFEDGYRIGILIIKNHKEVEKYLQFIHEIDDVAEIIADDLTKLNPQ
jgi:hypothetical protein